MQAHNLTITHFCISYSSSSRRIPGMRTKDVHFIGYNKVSCGFFIWKVPPSSEYYYGNCGSGQQGFFYILSNFYFHPGLSVRTSFSHNICLLGYRALAISHETSILAKHENMKLLPKITHKGNILSKCLGLESLKLAFTTRNRFYVSWSRVLLSM